MLEEDLAARAAELGEYLKKGLETLKEKHPVIKEVRGRGLMVGIEMDIVCFDVADRALEKGLLINCTHDTVLRFLPPLVIEKGQLDRALEILDEVLGDAG